MSNTFPAEVLLARLYYHKAYGFTLEVRGPWWYSSHCPSPRGNFSKLHLVSVERAKKAGRLPCPRCCKEVPE